MLNNLLPETMTAVILEEYAGVEGLRVEQRPVPRPGRNQILVKVFAAPINPSDLSFIEGNYAFKPPTPLVPGFEGSGVVVASGGGLMGKFLMHKRVAVIGQGGGTWAEYALVSARSAYPLGKGVSLEQGAMSVVNPLTALAFLNIIKKGDHRTILHAAAASALGQMLNRLCQSQGIRVIQIVRGEHQVELLKNQGAEIVLDSNSSDFGQTLRETCREYQPKLAFDPVAGRMTLNIVTAMPPKSKVIIYGGLSYQPLMADPRELIFRGKSIEGFWLSSWIAKLKLPSQLRLWQRAQKLIASGLSSPIRKEYPLDAVHEAIKEYQSSMTGGKILLRAEG